jgi:hypothetical protein
MLDWRGTLFSLASRSARSPESSLAKRKYGAAKKEGVYNKNAFSAAPEDALANVLPKALKLSRLCLVAWVRPMLWSSVIEAARPVI